MTANEGHVMLVLMLLGVLLVPVIVEGIRR